MAIAIPGTISFTYTPGQAPPADFEKASMIAEGELLADKAQRVTDFFAAADNGEYDLSPEEGIVSLRNAPAPGLVERGTDTISGFYSADSGLNATGRQGDHGGSSDLMVSADGKTIFMDRDVYLNDRYVANMESLTVNEDGTRTFSHVYRFWDHF